MASLKRCGFLRPSDVCPFFPACAFGDTRSTRTGGSTLMRKPSANDSTSSGSLSRPAIYGKSIFLLLPLAKFSSVPVTMKPLIFALCLLFACHGLKAQAPAWQPSPGHTQMPIWPGAVPDARPVAAPGNVTTTVTKPPVAGRPWVAVSNVSQPTMTVYSPTGTNTGVAVIVFPGGGYQLLAIGPEGTEICDWDDLAQIGRWHY